MRFTDEIACPDGVVYFVNAHAIGVRTPDALYRFMRGFAKPVVAAHHLFGPGAEPTSQPGLGSLAEPDAGLSVSAPVTLREDPR